MSNSFYGQALPIFSKGNTENNGAITRLFKYGRPLRLVRFGRMALTLLLLLCLLPVAIAAPRVSVVALFQGKAMLEIDGRRQLLAIGQTTPEGVRLLAATSSEAVLEVNGQRRTLQLSRQVGGNYAAPAERRQVQVARDGHGRFITSGTVNGSVFSFLVDTGANVIALNEHDARRAGVDFRQGLRVSVNTAAGAVRGYRVTLSRVEVGGISLPNATAVVLEGGSPNMPLLGMSFLGRLNMRQQGNLLVLEQLH